MIHACTLSMLPCCWCTENTGKEGIFPMGNGNIAGIGRVKESFTEEVTFEPSLERGLGFHLVERGAGMGSYVLQAHDLDLMYCTLAGSAWSSRESLIME